MKMASRSIDLISKKKNKLCVQHTFFSNLKKKQFALAARFWSSFVVVLHNCNLTLPSYTLFLWKDCRMSLPNILSPVFLFAFIFHCRSFSPCLPLAFLIVSPPLWIFMFFFRQNSSVLFSITRSSSFSVIHVSINIKNNVEKNTTLPLCFLSKSPAGHAISFQIKPWVAFRLPYL